jgi:6-phosphogluconolactonase
VTQAGHAAVSAEEVGVDDPPVLVQRVADWVARSAVAAITARGVCHLALSGGSTPRPVYALLATAEFRDLIDWSRMHVYFSDERAVPPADPSSNYGMARATLLDYVPIPPEQVHPMEAARADLDAAAAEYDRHLPPALDVLLLGLGTDGHTASLFPASPALAERRRRVVVVNDSPKPPPVRITITPPVIESARSIVVVAAGAEKAEAVVRALARHADPLGVPAALAQRGLWFLDRAAAARLSGPAT